MISDGALPEGLLVRCLDVLRKLWANERDLIRVVVEVVHELRDPAGEDEPQVSTCPPIPCSSAHNCPKPDDSGSNIGETPATVKTVRPASKPAEERTPEEQARADAIDLRCLALCIGMLERVNGVSFTHQRNSVY